LLAGCERDSLQLSLLFWCVVQIFSQTFLMLVYYSSFSSRVDPCSYLNRFPTKPSKTISPPGKLEGNTVHRVHCTVSPEIALWVTAILKFLQSRNEWGYGVVFYLLHAFILLFIQVFLGFSPCLIHACIIIYLA
jgi:hypothetical protein